MVTCRIEYVNNNSSYKYYGTHDSTIECKCGQRLLPCSYHLLTFLSFPLSLFVQKKSLFYFFQYFFYSYYVILIKIYFKYFLLCDTGISFVFFTWCTNFNRIEIVGAYRTFYIVVHHKRNRKTECVVYFWTSIQSPVVCVVIYRKKMSRIIDQSIRLFFPFCFHLTYCCFLSLSILSYPRYLIPNIDVSCIYINSVIIIHFILIVN